MNPQTAVSTIQIGQITTMYVSLASNTLPEIGEPIYTTVTPAQANAAEPVFTIAVARPRRAVLITNKTNRAVSIKEGSANSEPTLFAPDLFVSIPAGSSYTIEDWSGEIVGLMSGNYAIGGKIIVKELPYLLPV